WWKQDKWQRIISVILRPQPKNLVAKHAPMPAKAQMLRFLRQAWHAELTCSRAFSLTLVDSPSFIRVRWRVVA
ncbi:MAG: hypothetical protein QGI88_13125, partial [SAR202 cluster bacterium]|nr:hypothetical protein [SAR202 cluster bacterium]